MKTSHAWINALLGALCILFFLVGILTQIQTNEAWANHGGLVELYKPDWSILWQPYQLITGTLPSGEAASVFFGWTVVVACLVFFIGYESSKHAVGSKGTLKSNLYLTGMFLMFVINTLIDYTYGTVGSGTWGHIGFAIATSFAVAFLGVIGAHLIEKAWADA